MNPAFLFLESVELSVCDSVITLGPAAPSFSSCLGSTGSLGLNAARAAVFLLDLAAGWQETAS